MTWRARLVDAALDGVPFLYRSVSSEFGRRTITYEFPDRDAPFVDDLGRRARRWTIDAYVLGSEYMDRRDALQAVLEARGEHTFSHPYGNDIPVRCDGPISVTETPAEGGKAVFRISLVEAGEEDEVLRIPDTPGRVSTAADRVIVALAANTRFDLLGAIQDAINAAAAAVQNAASALRRARGKIAALMNTLETVGQAIDDFENEIDTLIDTPQAMVNAFAGLAYSLFNLLRTASSIADSVPTNTIPTDFNRPDTARNVFRDLNAFEVDAAEPPATTPQRIQEGANRAAVAQMVRAANIAEAARVMARLDLESANQALAIRDELGDAFDDLLDDETTDDPLYEALADLRTEITLHLVTVAQTLPVVSGYTPPITAPALVISHALYGDASHDLDIVARNRIAHPGFAAGGVELEVLSYA